MTLSEIREQLRFRLGEISAGTWSDAELNTQIYNAEKKVCEDCVTKDEALLTDSVDRPLVKGQYQYVLPSDLIDILGMDHWHNGIYYPMTNAHIRTLLKHFQPSTTSDICTHFEIFRTTSDTILSGIATGGSKTTLVDSEASFSSDDISINVDKAWNYDDDSKAVITEITDANTLTFSGGLSTGYRNSFLKGDRYHIVTGEQTYRVLYVYPVPTAGDTQEVEAYDTGADNESYLGDYGGTTYRAAQSFQLDADTVIKEVELQLGTTVGTPEGSLIIRIETNTGGLPSGTLVNLNAVTNIGNPSGDAWNKAQFVNEFRLSANTTYHIVTDQATQNEDNYWTWQIDRSSPSYDDGQCTTKAGAAAWSAGMAKDAMFRLYEAVGDESLVLHYARYPSQMTNDTDNSEVQEYAREAVYLWAEYLASLKRYGRRSYEAKETYVLYKTEIADIKDKLVGEGMTQFGAVKEVMFSQVGIPRHNNVTIQDALPLG